MKTAIVTGVSRGLGEALALALLERSYHVTGVGRTNSARLADARYRYVACDFADPSRIEASLGPALRSIAGQQPAQVCLINNAASAGPVGIIGKLTESAIGESIAVNLTAPIALCNLFCGIFADDAIDTRVINVSSGAAQRALPGGGIYSIAKSGLEMLTTALAAERAAPNFRAISVRPGIIDTEMQQFMRSQPREILPSVELFEGFHQSGQLVAPATVAKKLVERLVQGDVESGRTYTYQEL
jgi:NAD(P)-dependent dehydrogenase (short-subunit alcohol dehydrogenase family)